MALPVTVIAKAVTREGGARSGAAEVVPLLSLAKLQAGEVPLPRITEVDTASFDALVPVAAKSRAGRAPPIIAAIARLAPALEASLPGVAPATWLARRESLLPQEVATTAAPEAASVIAAVAPEPLRPASAILGERAEPLTGNTLELSMAATPCLPRASPANAPVPAPLAT